MNKLRVRVYNVGFGDAILISVPDKGPDGKPELRRILIDVGNAYRPRIKDGEGHADVVYEAVVKDIVNELKGRPLDLYVMTHEHYDHVEGLPYADREFFGNKLKEKLQVQDAWFTGSAKPGYYDEHKEAREKTRKRRLALEKTYQAISSFLQAAPEWEENPYIRALMVNNNKSLTDKCVEYLQGLARHKHTWYVDREVALAGKHPFQEARFKIWAPEEDTAIYYRRFQPMALGMTPAEGRAKPTLTHSTPPGGVDAGAFYNLVEMRRRGFLDNLLAIDKAENDTSIVFLLEWRGWKLLFTADAEERSWKEMKKHDVLEEVHFMKVSHHGGESGMPPVDVLEKIWPVKSKVSEDGKPPVDVLENIWPVKSKVSSDGKPRYAVVSTRKGTYPNNPTEATLEELRERCVELYSTEEHLEDEGYMYIDLEFEGGGNKVTVRKG